MMVADSVYQLLLAETISSIAASQADNHPDTSDSDLEHADEQRKIVGAKIEALGHSVGYRFIERIAESKMLPAAPLEIMKTLCKDFWGEVFGKSIDKLQTNHKGDFVLIDNEFKWLARYSSSGAGLTEAANQLLNFPCGLIRGALENLGVIATVYAERERVEMQYITSFKVKIKP